MSIMIFILLTVGSISPMANIDMPNQMNITHPPVLPLTLPIDFVDEVNYKVVTARISAYAPYDNKSGICNDGDTLTSRGKPAGRQYVAVDENLIPYGSKIEIEGFDGEVFIAGDTGGTMRNLGREGIYAVDVFFDTHQQAMDFGIQWREIKIYDE